MIYGGLGWCAVAIAIAGAWCPGCRRRCSSIVAAYCFSRSSPRFERWLRDNRWLGPCSGGSRGPAACRGRRSARRWRRCGPPSCCRRPSWLATHWGGRCSQSGWGRWERWRLCLACAPCPSRRRVAVEPGTGPFTRPRSGSAGVQACPDPHAANAGPEGLRYERRRAGGRETLSIRVSRARPARSRAPTPRPTRTAPGMVPRSAASRPTRSVPRSTESSRRDPGS